MLALAAVALLASPPEPQPEPINEPKTAREWVLQIQPGASLLPLAQHYGGGARLGAWYQKWRNRFLIGGGPMLHYAYTVRSNRDLGGFTPAADLIIGGGTPGRFAVYGHATFGLGVGHGDFGDVSDTFFTLRLKAGVGAYGMLSKRVSLGVLVDAGLDHFSLGVDALLTIGVHFPGAS